MRYKLRSNVLFKAGPAFASSFTIQAYRIGGIVQSGSAGITITLRRGHGFRIGDRILLDPGTTNIFTEAIIAVDADTITMTNAYTVTKGMVIFNMEVDTGGTTPDFDGSSITMYDDPEGAESSSSVATSATGDYSYYPSHEVYWELARTSNSVVLHITIEIQTDTFHVDNYGARGDGTPFDGFSIQSAIDDAELQGIGTVKLGPRTYNIHQTQLVLDGNKTILEGPGNILASGTGTVEAISVQGTNIKLRSFDITGNQSVGTIANQANTIEFNGATSCSAEDVTVTAAGKSGFVVWENSRDIDVSKGNRVIGSDYNGIYATGAQEVRIHGNYIENCCVEDQTGANKNTKAGVNVLGNASYITDGISVMNNMVSGTWSCAYRVQSNLGINPKNTIVNGNTGICASGAVTGEGVAIAASSTTISNNIIKNAFAEGILVFGGTPTVNHTLENINIISNTIIDCSYGNALHNGIDIEVSGTVGASGSAIVRDINIIGNTFENASGQMQRMVRFTPRGPVDVSNINVIGNTGTGLAQDTPVYIGTSTWPSGVQDWKTAIYSQGNRCNGNFTDQGIGLRTLTATANVASVVGPHKDFNVTTQDIGQLVSGQEGETTRLYFTDGDSTIYDNTHLSGTNIYLFDQTTWQPKAGDTLALMQVGSSWKEMSRTMFNGLRIGTITSGTTPSVEGSDIWNLSYAAPGTITNFTGGFPGRVVKWVAKNNACTMQFSGVSAGSNLIAPSGFGGNTWNLKTDEFATGFFSAPNWYITPSRDVTQQ